MGQLFKNNAYSVLAAGIGAGDLSLSVSPGHGDRFPAVTTPDWAVVTLEDSSKNIEVVKVTTRAAGSDAMTIVRAQEGTTARTWLAGDIVALRVTAGGLGQLQGDIATTAAAVASHAAASDPHPGYLTPAEANAAYQPIDPDLLALAALITAANKLPYFTGAGSAALADFTAFARTLLDDADAAAALATLGAQAALVSGTNIKTVGGQSLLGGGNITVSDARVQLDPAGEQSRSVNTSYLNGAKFRFVSWSFNEAGAGSSLIQVSPDNSTWVTVAHSYPYNYVVNRNLHAIIPPNYYWRYQTSGSVTNNNFFESV